MSSLVPMAFLKVNCLNQKIENNNSAISEICDIQVICDIKK